MGLKVEEEVARARRHEKRGETADAIRLYEGILERFPANQRAHAALAALRAQADAPPLERVQALEALYRRGDHAATVAEGLRLAARFPRAAIVWTIIGAAHAAAGEPAEAEASFRHVLALDPGNVDAHSNLGVALKAQARTEEALASYLRAVALDPAHAGAHFNVGNLLREAGRLDEALAHYEKARQRNDQSADLHYNIAGALQEKGEVEASVRHYRRALAIAPGLDKARAQLLHQLAHLCDWEGIAALGERTAGLGIDGEPVEPFALLFLEDAPARQKVRSERWAAAKFGASALPAPAPLRREGKLRIGYLSADFHQHATMHLMSQVLAHHDRAAFEVFVYSYGAHSDARVDAILDAAASRVHRVRDLSDADIARLARADGLDIAIDLKGYTQHGRSGILAHRAAPVQVAYLGYPGTLGAPFIDYLVADPVIIPAAHREHYSERIIYLPHSYHPTDETRAIPETPLRREDHGLPAEGTVLASFNATYKITPREWGIWMRLLREVEGSVLWLLRSNPWAETNLRKAARAAGIDDARIIFAERMPHLEHLARQQLADLFLDTFNVNAHTTASDALWAGLPVVTRIGEQFAARVAASILRAAGLPELIAETDAAYEALALRLATDRDALAALRGKLAEARTNAPLFDSARYTRALEDGLRQAHRRHAEGRAPDTIYARDG